MLTVTKLHPFHDILHGNADAIAAGDNGYTEVLVIIDRGDVVAVRTPSGGDLNFSGDDDWIFNDIRDAFWRGGDTALASDPRIAAAPVGWTHWGDLKPGDVASSGDHHGNILVVGTPGLFKDSLGTPCSAAWCIGEPRTMSDRLQASTSTAVPGISPFAFKPDRAPPLPFVRIDAQGLSDAQLRHVAEAVATGEHGIAYIIEHLPAGVV